MPSQTLAKKIFEENKSLFNKWQSVHSLIRYYRGSSGNDGRKKLKDTRFLDYNPHGLPPTEESDYYPFKFPKKANNVLVLSDIHVPYHNIEALTCALNYGLEHDCNAILLNGDTWDCYQGSNFIKDMRKRDLAYERDCVVSLLEKINELFPDAYKFFKVGNHEERWQKYLMVKAPELLNMTEFRMENVLRLKELGWEYETCPKQRIMLGGLVAVHGHEFGHSVFSPVNVARGLFLRAKSSAICGHHHQTSEHTESDINGKITTTWSVGCLCELHPDYLPINKWNHGFLHVIWNEDDFHVRNMRIANGKII